MDAGQTSNRNSDKVETRRRVSPSQVDFAMKKVQQFFMFHEHEDIDETSSPESQTTDEQWANFIEQFYAASQ